MVTEIEHQIDPRTEKLLADSRELSNFAICLRDGGSPYLQRSREMLEGRQSESNPYLIVAVKNYEVFGRVLPDAMRELSVTSSDAGQYIELVRKAQSDPMSFSQEEITEIGELQAKIQSVADFLLAKGLTPETINLVE